MMTQECSEDDRDDTNDYFSSVLVIKYTKYPLKI